MKATPFKRAGPPTAAFSFVDPVGKEELLVEAGTLPDEGPLA